MTGHEELIARLEAQVVGQIEWSDDPEGDTISSVPDPLCMEAAQALREQARAVEEARADIRAYEATMKAIAETPTGLMEARARALEEAASICEDNCRVIGAAPYSSIHSALIGSAERIRALINKDGRE